MNFLHFSSLGAGRAKDGLGLRTTWAMWAVAVLLAVLAVAVPPKQSVSADSPTVEIEVIDLTVPQGKTYKQACEEFDGTGYVAPGTTITTEYEEACVKIVATGVTIDDWQLNLDYETNSYDRYKDAGPGFIQPPQDAYTFDYSCAAGDGADCDDSPGTINATFVLDQLVPDSDGTVTILLQNSEYDVLAEDSTTFRTKSGCYQEQKGYDPATDDLLRDEDGKLIEVWFGGANASKNTRTELVMDVYVENDSSKVPRNSGRCVYYQYSYYDEDGDEITVPATGWNSTYVYRKGSGNRAWIKVENPIPGTYYHFGVSFHPKGGGGTSGFGEITPGPALIISVEDITQTDATVTVTLPDDEYEDMDERMVHLVYFKTADEHLPNLDDKRVKPPGQVTENGSTSFTLSNLTFETKYKVKASLISGFPTYETESKTFLTKSEAIPNAPNNLDVAEGNEKLTLTWEAPTVQVGVTVNDYKVQWKENTVTDWDAQTGVTEVSVGANVLTREITGLDNSTTYDVRVRADNSVISDNYSWANGTGTTLPDTPENLEVASGNRQLTVTWDEPDENGSVAITGYAVQYMKTSDPGWTTHPTVNAVSGTSSYETTILSLVSSTDYEVRVRAVTTVVLTDEDGYNWGGRRQRDNTGQPCQPSGRAGE